MSDETHEGFTVGLALVDAVPVLLFCAGMVLIATRYTDPLFVIGAVAMAVGGLSKVIWKLVIGISGKDVLWLKKLFRPCMFGGFGLIIAALLIGTFTHSINWGTVGAAIAGMPQVILFILAVCGLVAMGVLASKLDQTLAKSNWIEQLTNTFAQLMLFLGILIAVIG